MGNLVSDLFTTKALKACEANKPFWLTSGKIGAYFINTEFLYGSEEDSANLLKMVDEELSNPQTLPKKVFERVQEQYNTNSIYKNVIDTMIETINKNININDIDFISGGERRDWVFSNIIAYILKKPHITIFKDLTTLESDSEFAVTKQLDSLSGKNVLHISDLITEAASYINLWVPTIEKLGGKMNWTVTVVDRVQGGSDKLTKSGIITYPLIKVDRTLFTTALENGSITEDQYKMINNYLDNPDDTMREFLKTHPEFIEESLKGTGKTLIRVKKCLEEDIYGLTK
ncbi:MAG: orotate phosphoribosyltransferase [Lachnospiraceae bacterium]|nr:orotate phosphoribosyltransferase [Lachnospiraceae bacterium]